ncbi:hypothetical protein F503_07315 [Ophiostoma piceae UAMH 11346]|uniref:Uncharacterized protein n=1 Tax=Ophiostoma piceae (strain UAMH 11346) TaxID=1262450 RepID=S3C7N7_OPHP1|nr:hypothetical protein F503_07315 [Ophiostoma piceae UAMH 11346]
MFNQSRIMLEPTDFTDEERALFSRLNIGMPGGLPMPSFIRPSEVVTEAKPLAASIFADWASLTKLVGSDAGQNEILLLDRWKSMKQWKRRDLLAAAWLSSAETLPDEYKTPLPEAHRPDLVAWRRQSGRVEWTKEDRAAFLWPHINAQDLASKTRPLLLMAASRTQASPDAFAEADLETTHPGKACLALLPRYLNQYSMLFSARTTPDTYGRLYPWDQLPKKDGDDEDNASFETRGTHPGEGLWILIIQARLYRFLVLAVGTVLGSSGRLNGGIGKDTTNKLYTDVPLCSLEAPYGQPQAGFDLQPLLDLVIAKLWEANDHVWALRSDPAYFRMTLDAWAANDMTLNSTDRNIVTVNIVNACIRHALEQTEIWNILYAKVHLLAQQMEKHAVAVAEAKAKKTKLPRDLLLSVYAVIYHIRCFENDSIGLLRGAVADGGDKIWALTGLKDETMRQLFGPQALLDELELDMRAGRETLTDNASSCISPWVAHEVATLALYTRCNALLNRFQPWTGAYDTDIQQDKETRAILATDFQMSMGRLRALLKHTISVPPPPFVNTDNDAEYTFELDTLALFWEGVHQALEAKNAMTPRIKDMLARQPNAATLMRVWIKGAQTQTVDCRAARVFRALFQDGTDQDGSTPPAVTWPDIVHALHAAGLSVERLHASVWLFTPRSSNKTRPGTKSLQPSLFYEPQCANGTAKLAPDTARLIGIRLNRAYGWDGSTFSK